MARIRLLTRKDPFLSIFSPLRYQRSSLPKTLKMAATQSNSKRPTCPSCSKPSKLCLCSRIQNPGIDNKVSVTILQHSLEKKHPLNAVRIAKLGLKNVEVVNVSDVNFGAGFVIQLLESVPALDGRSFDSGDYSDGTEIDDLKSNDFDSIEKNEDGSDREAAIFVAIGKHGVISDIKSKWLELQPQDHALKGPNFDQLLASQEAIEALSRGFVVKKYQNRQINGSIDLEEYDEYEIEVPSGSVLLFPSETAVGVDELQAMNVEVKKLIVLDGTWSKAKRMYKENPWLRILPHLKLDISEVSLYNEVRHQPCAGCLSTIESIVYALKALGDNNQGLDHLLDVFESMVGDQRRCKDERLMNSSSP